jgi:glycosyltransferase involved in cell wall biosynthesis
MRLGLGIRTGLRRWRRGTVIDDEYLEAREVTALLREPAAPLVERATRERMDVAIVVPFFSRGSGGHMTIANLTRGLGALGHACSLWIDDPGRRCAGGPDGAVRNLRDWFGPFAADVHYGFGDWKGADVVVATGWQTVARVRTLGGGAARAYLVQDHEPEFFGTSAHRMWAEDSYRHGFYPITAGRWLAELMRSEYRLPASHFDLGVDSALYRPQAVARRDDVVLFYARASTPRRAVPIALVALAELKRRRPDLQLWFFGHGWPPSVDYPFRKLGNVDGPELARLYAEATVGLVLSMTNYSLVAQEMMACGLPCVELDSPSIVAAFGRDGPIELTAPEPLAIAEAIERLLDDSALRAQRAHAGAGFVATKTWDAASRQVEAGLRAALEQAHAGATTRAGT